MCKFLRDMFVNIGAWEWITIIMKIFRLAHFVFSWVKKNKGR